jgi:starvation-inducible DNA-binding protein
MMVLQGNPSKKGCPMDHSGNDGHKPNLFPIAQPNIGLDPENRNSAIGILNKKLADEIVLTLKTRSAFWNVSGINSLELRRVYFSQYRKLNKISDALAERVKILDGIVIGSLHEFLQNTRLIEQPGSIPDILQLLADHETSIRLLRDDIRKCHDELEDEGTFDLLSRSMRTHEKIAWILRSYIEISPSLFN